MKSLPLILVALLLTGCASTWTRFEPFSTTRLSAKPKSYDVLMSPGVPIGQRYEKLGVVWSSWYTYSSAEQHVRDKAREIGADAVISLRYTTYEVNVNQSFGSFSSSGYVNPSGAYSASGSGTVTSVGYTDGYPKVVGIAIRFLDDISSQTVQFTNPNVVEQPSIQK